MDLYPPQRHALVRLQEQRKEGDGLDTSSFSPGFIQPVIPGVNGSFLESALWLPVNRRFLFLVGFLIRIKSRQFDTRQAIPPSSISLSLSIQFPSLHCDPLHTTSKYKHKMVDAFWESESLTPVCWSRREVCAHAWFLSGISLNISRCHFIEF